MYLEKDNRIQDWKLKQRRLCIPFSITGHATPASKSQSADLERLILSTEGKTADATAADTGTNFTTEDDSSGIFGLLLMTGQAVRKVQRAVVEQRTGSTATNKDQAVVFVGASNTGITAHGNIALSVTAAGLDLSGENFDGVLVVDYVIE